MQPRVQNSPPPYRVARSAVTARSLIVGATPPPPPTPSSSSAPSYRPRNETNDPRRRGDNLGGAAAAKRSSLRTEKCTPSCSLRWEEEARNCLSKRASRVERRPTQPRGAISGRSPTAASVGRSEITVQWVGTTLRKINLSRYHLWCRQADGGRANWLYAAEHCVERRLSPFASEF